MSSLSTLLTSLQRGFLKNVLEGAGIALGTSALLLVSLNTAINAFRSSLGNIPTAILDLAGLAGFDIGFSVILGAIVARYVQNAGKLTLRRK